MSCKILIGQMCFLQHPCVVCGEAGQSPPLAGQVPRWPLGKGWTIATQTFSGKLQPFLGVLGMGSTPQETQTFLVMENAVWAAGGGGVSTPGINKNRRLRVAARTGWGQDSGILFVSSALLDGSEARCESAPMPAGPSRGCSLAAVGAGSSSGILVALAGNRRWGGNSACVA